MERIDHKIVERLKKLLALSASDNENEANLAMRKAEDLMRRHNLSVADVALNGSSADIESVEVSGLTKSKQKWELHLGICIAHTFNGRAISYRLGPGKGWRFTFVAGRTDLELIVDLYERLRQTIRRMSSAYVRANPNPYVSPRTLHNSYRLGMLRTIKTRLEQVRKNTMPNDESRNVYGMSGKELMVVKSNAVDRKVEELFSKLKISTSRISTVNMTAYRRGQADGRNVSLHRSLEGSEGSRFIE